MTTDKDKIQRGSRSARSVASLLSGLKDMEKQRAFAAARVDDAVSILRSPDADGWCLASWQEIADALGITKQGAMARYKRKGL